MNGISGEAGNFEVQVTRHPRYVDLEKCIACGLCAEKCPRKVANEQDSGLGQRKAVYVQYAQAVPLKYVIDPRECIYLTKGRCRACEKFCPTGAIRFDDRESELTLKVGAVVLAQGSRTFDPGVYDTFGYRSHPNIVTTLEFERILSSSGPYGGHLVRPSDGREPRKIAWLQCIGSRDEHPGARSYCSGVCCTFAIKEAMLAKEHVRGDLDTAIFYIDLRTYGKDYERYSNRAREELGVRFIKSRVSHLDPVGDTGRLLIRYVDEGGRRMEETFDLVVLSVGLAQTPSGVELAGKLGVALNRHQYAEVSSFRPVESERPGIFVCGTCQAPKDIPSCVVDSSAAAAGAGGLLSEARGSQTRTREIPSEIDIRGEAPRVGVFVCCCGTNIAGVVDVPAVVEFAKTLPGVVHAEQNLFSCAQDSQEKMARIISDRKLNKVVVAACTPRTHEPLFQETLANTGLNKYLFEMANIRNQCSWVHKDHPEQATEKAKDLVRMAAAKAVLLQPLAEPTLDINQKALVVGGGLAGLSAARTLADQGFKTYLLEKGEALGGQARRLHQTWKGEEVPPFLDGLIDSVNRDERIKVFLNTQVSRVDGFVGNFKTTIESDRETRVLSHGVTIIATGASELKPDHYLYGKDPRVLTGLELQRRFIEGDPDLKRIRTAVFIQCVGSRIPERPYCSRVCCTRSVKSALSLKEVNPGARIFVIYREMRTYGLREDLYREARQKGISFIRYDFDQGLTAAQDNGALTLSFADTVLKRKMEVRPDLLVLALAMVPEKENPLAQFYKVPQNADGFFVEAHVKLRPVDFATDGVFLCGLAQAPKALDESITEAQGAAARAIALLSAGTISVTGTVASVNPAACSSCGVCVSICPYSAPQFNEKTGKAHIQATLCKGCGLCTASCRSGAITLKGFETDQVMAMIESAL